MSNLAGILQQVLSGDEQVRQNSQRLLQQEKEKNPENYLLELSRTLASSSVPVPSRQLGGIILKNTLLNLNNEEFLSNFWEKVSDPSKEEIRNNTLGSLAAEDRNVRLSASQAVSTIIKLDLPQKRWPGIVEILVQNATNQNQAFKEASLTTLGYLCDGLESSVLNAGQVDSILTAIAVSITEEKADIKAIAIKAFKNSIKFAKKNFEVTSEREYILRLILTGCQDSDEGIRVESYRLLIEVVSHYYDFLGPHLVDLGTLTFQTIRSDSVKVALLAFEVWNILGDTEFERKENPQPEYPLRGYLNTAQADLLILLLENIHRVHSDDDDWDVNKACASVLSVLTQITGDKIVDEALKYIDLNIKSPDWRFRQSALLVIGSILEGPSQMKIAPIGKAVTVIIGLLSDENASVKQTAAWCLSKIAQFQYKLVTQPIHFTNLVKALLEALNQSPKIACHACWAFVNLIEKSSEIRLFKLGVFEHVFAALISSALRQDAFHPEHNLQTAAYSALSTLIEKSPDDCVSYIENQVSSFIILFKQNAAVASNEHLHNCLCEVLCSCFSKANNVSDEACKEFLEALTISFNARNGVYEEGIMALGALTHCIGPRFVNYLQVVGPFISFALQKQDAISLCKAGTMFIGDIARALGDLAKNFVADLIQPLISNLRSENASSQVKVQSIESLSDVVSNCKESTSGYLNDVLALIHEAAAASISQDKDDESDLSEYLRQLREAIIEFYENLVQGMMVQADSLLSYVPNIVAYILTVTQDKFRPKPSIHRCAIGIIGDLCKTYGKSVSELVKTQPVLNYIHRYKVSNNLKIRELANWTSGLLNSI
jgi:importin subunit beta-1